ncbi:MAG: S8 family serine peptidase [Nocardioidaceae bacterium]
MAHLPPTRKVRRAAIALSASVVCALGLGAVPATAQPQSPSPSPAVPGPVATSHLRGSDAAAAKLTGVDRLRSGRHDVFVELTGQGAADAAVRARSAAGADAAVTAARSRRAAVARTARAVVATAKGKDSHAARLFEVSNAVPGVAVHADAAALRAIAGRSDVVKVSPLVPRTVTNASAAQLTKVLDAWRSYGVTGRGVRIGVIDTGIDFTHADFGGVGTADAYKAALANETDPSWHDTLPALAQAKIAGGYDFVGNHYNADPKAADYQPVPHPDGDPLDCNEHGTHVSGTAAGYGVNADGSTFQGDYSQRTGADLDNMRIGPGMAPQAKLYALKVFGCTGSTNEVIPALDWALDPNGDGDFSDHLDIVNMSLGGDYGVVDDPENDVVNELSAHGVLSVIAMGNNGDLTDTGGAPGNAVSSLAVASSIDPMQLRDGLRVNAPSGAAGIAAGQVSVAYPWRSSAPVTGDVVALSSGNDDGCDPLSAPDAARVQGKIAWLEWDDNDATRKCGSVKRSANVKAAGAIGAIFTSGLDVFGAGITGDKDIPVFQLPKQQTDRLRPAVDAGTLNVTFDGSLVGTIKDKTPAIADMLSGFSSRGTHGSLGVVKPDVTAPGDTITSAGMGTGNDQLTISGTSMATPHTAGIAALVKSAHPDWSVLQVKAAVMNTAGHDLYTGPNHTGNVYGPARVGAGRVDALAAVSTKLLAYSPDAGMGVSASFGPVPAGITEKTVTRTRKIRVQNTGAATTQVSLSYQPVVSQPGVSYSVSPASLKVKAGDSAQATVTMTIVPSQLRHTIDPTMDTTQLGVPRQFVPDASGRVLVTPAGGDALRVPVYGAAKPASQTTMSARPGQIVTAGTGVDQGTGATAYRSLFSVLQLGATSGTLPTCTAVVTTGCTYNQSSKAGDLKYVGAGSSSDALWFGIATQADWATIGNSITPYVDYDTNADGRPDYETYVANYPGDGSTDVLTAVTVDLAAGSAVDVEPVNFNWGDVDTNVFDTNVLLLPVAKDAIGAASTGSHPITYQVGTFDGASGSDLDDSPLVSYDAGTPAVQVSAPLYQDQGKVAVPYTLNGTAATTGAKALVLHLHGLPGRRAEVLDLKR